tara:strand:+ start:519 stop:1718 length:1200 start_codon:yes stop_codon:yes gene_type:complete
MLKYDVIIIGAGMVGLSLAHQLKIKKKNLSILIIEKESKVGNHSSGRNSGILHAGIYYPPNTLKANICISGAKRLTNWCIEQKLPIIKCGKVIAPQKKSLDPQLDVLYERGIQNGAKVSFINETEFIKKVPNGRTASGRAIWSPNTYVINPKKILDRLKNLLRNKSVKISLSTKIIDFNPSKKLVIADKIYSYDYLFNCAGLNADLIAKKFNLSENKFILPFKGIYWELSNDTKLTFNTNLYPVPDLDQPFLGIHVTPSTEGKTYLGPTAIPALGRENYILTEKIEPFRSIRFMSILTKQFLTNKNGFRKYALEQSLHGLKPLFLKSAKELVPNLKEKDLIASNKVGIRPQLYDSVEGKLVQDFLIEKTESSLHILNAISPAFTASFEFADYIIKNSDL